MALSAKLALLLIGIVASEAFSLLKHKNHTKGKNFGRIVNGEEAVPHEFPFLAKLTVFFGEKAFDCGGTLINKNHVLTAAHCIVDDETHETATRIRVTLGAHDLNSNEDTITVEVNNFYMDGYDPEETYADIAVLELSQSVTYSDKIQPACLDHSGGIHVGEQTTVAGWGTIDNDVSGPGYLLKINLPVLPDDTCEKSYRSSFYPEVMMCAGYTDGSKDSCQGDSGGPLFKHDGEKFVVVGIVSFGMRCAEPKFPGVYTRLEHFIDFVRSKAGNVCVA